MLSEVFHRGGPLMWLLVPVSVVATAVVVERLLFWGALSLSALRHRGLAGRARRQELGDHDRERLGRIRDPLPYLLDRLRRSGHRGDLVSAGLETEVARAGSGVGLLQLLAEISTSVGLFGTVWGVTTLLPAYRGGDVKGVVDGLATALYTTVGGLTLFLVLSPIAGFFVFLTERLRLRLETEIQAAVPPGAPA